MHVLRGKFPKMGTPTLLYLHFLVIPSQEQKNPQNLEHVKCLVESSAAGFTQIRPALNKRPYSIKGGGLRLYSTHRNHQKPEGRPMECAIPYTVSAFAKKKSYIWHFVQGIEWLIYLIIKCKTRKEHKDWRPCNVHPFSNVYLPSTKASILCWDSL